jgi:hypothetical protein
MTDDTREARKPEPDPEEERDSVRNDTPSPPQVPNETNGAVDVDAAHDRAS